MSTNTIRLHRVLRATPERIYRAFLDADAMAKWLPPNGFIGKVHHLDAKVSGAPPLIYDGKIGAGAELTRLRANREAQRLKIALLPSFY